MSGGHSRLRLINQYVEHLFNFSCSLSSHYAWLDAHDCAPPPLLLLFASSRTRFLQVQCADEHREYLKNENVHANPQRGCQNLEE